MVKRLRELDYLLTRLGKLDEIIADAFAELDSDIMFDFQSKIALGSGGFSGKGYLEGTQSYLQYLPEKQTDFIFTLIGEEFGFIGTIFIIFLFLLVISICFYISIKSSHIFGRILSIGVGTNIFIYVIMNISMVSGLMPVVGIPLPLVSYGGSAMLSIMITIGLVLNIELNANIKKISYA